MGELTERFERKTILSNGKGSDSRRYNSERLSVLYSYYQLYIMCIMNDRFLSSFSPQFSLSFFYVTLESLLSLLFFFSFLSFLLYTVFAKLIYERCVSFTLVSANSD